MGPGRDEAHRTVVDVRYERRKVPARHAEADEAYRLCAGDTEIAIRAAQEHGLAVTERDLPLALNDGAAAGEIHRKEKIVQNAMGARSRLLAQAGECSRENASSGQEPLGEPHVHPMVRKGLQRKQPTFAQAADRNAAARWRADHRSKSETMRRSARPEAWALILTRAADEQHNPTASSLLSRPEFAPVRADWLDRP